MKKVYLSSFFGECDREVFALAIDYLRKNPDTVLSVEPRVYNITTDRAREAQNKVMTGEYTSYPQDIMFSPDYVYDIGIDLSAIRDCKIEAEGAVLLIDGFMEPLCVAESENVEVSGFTILHKRKPYSKGRVVSAELSDGVYKSLIEFDNDCPVCEKSPFSLRVLYYDTENEEPLLSDFQRVEFTDTHHITSYDKSRKEIKAGMEYYTCHTYHSRPAVMIENSKNITLENITVNNNCGMGFLGHRCENLTLKGCKVTPVDGDRMSTNTDSSHFTCCKGELKLFDCIFEYQGDDFTNIHGYYQKIHSNIADNAYLISDLTPTGIHAQVIDYPDVGDTMELCNIKNLEPLGKYRVLESYPMYKGEWYVKIVLDHPLPDEWESLRLANVTRIPKVHISGCASLDHYARGIVLKARGALIENCYFRNVRETAITAYAEPFWGEGPSPSDIVIRGCRFEDCGWIGSQVSAILTSVPVHGEAYNAVKNVRVEDNIIKTDRPYSMRFVNADSVTVKNNRCDTETVFEKCSDVNYEE